MRVIIICLKLVILYSIHNLNTLKTDQRYKIAKIYKYSGGENIGSTNDLYDRCNVLDINNKYIENIFLNRFMPEYEYDKKNIIYDN